MLSRSDVAKHGSKGSCWTIINGTAYDLTSFLESHPGGPESVLNYAGKDATEAFEQIHSSDTIQKYISEKQIMGPVTEEESPRKMETKATDQVTKPKRMRLKSIVNISEFEVAASQRLSPRALAFFKAGADDEYTAQWNRKSWQSLRFRPRVLRPIQRVDISTSILGVKFSTPFFICPAGGGKLAHPKGEVLMTKAASRHGTLHWVCNMAGCTQDEIANARAPDQTLYYQIYAKSDLSISEQEIKSAIALGYKGFALTVDAIRATKRERDMRLNIKEVEDSKPSSDNDEDDDDGELNTTGGISAQRGALWSSFDWVSAAKWLRNLTDLPIAIKGIQSWEDAEICMRHGLHPWLSNHGGRQLEGAPSAIETLLEMRENCPEVFQNCDVIVDGGITRGTDIVKALALGAKGVGIGRPFLYALTFGEAGVNKAIQILQQEVETTMALLGVTCIDELRPCYVKLRGEGSKL